MKFLDIHDVVSGIVSYTKSKTPRIHNADALILELRNGRNFSYKTMPEVCRILDEKKIHINLLTFCTTSSIIKEYRTAGH